VPLLDFGYASKPENSDSAAYIDCQDTTVLLILNKLKLNSFFVEKVCIYY
jgi:hypothetical protein